MYFAIKLASLAGNKSDQTVTVVKDVFLIIFSVAFSLCHLCYSISSNRRLNKLQYIARPFSRCSFKLRCGSFWVGANIVEKSHGCHGTGPFICIYVYIF